MNTDRRDVADDAENRARHPGAAVDYVVDETTAPVDPPREEVVVAADAPEPRVAARTGPSRWWRMGLIGLATLVAMLLVLQFLSGGPASTDVVPGTPADAPGPTAPVNGQ